MKKIKLGKIAAVAFLTALIWVWADLALEETYTLSNVTITITKSTNPKLWVSFDDGQASASLETVELKGSGSKVAEFKRALKEGEIKREFVLEPEQQGFIKSGSHVLDVLEFLRQSDLLKEYALTVQSAKPQELTVKVEELVKKPLAIKVLDQNQFPVKTRSIEPSRVEMFVPQGWTGPELTATVQLTEGEIEQARESSVTKTPFIVLSGQVRQGPPVTVSVSTEDYRLTDYSVRATLDIAMNPTVVTNPTLQGRYWVEIMNLNELLSRPIAIKATQEAKERYMDQKLPSMTLHIYNEDVTAAGEIKREVVYNFPTEFLQNDEIKLNERPRIARFKVVELQPEQ